MVTSNDILVNVLGPVATNTTGERQPVRGQAGEILCLLASRFPEQVTTDALAEALWPNKAPKTAATGLRVVLHRLRQHLGGPDTVLFDNLGYRLGLTADDFDHLHFERLVAEANTSLAAGHASEAATTLIEALGLWRGDAFQPFGHSDLLRPVALHIASVRHDAEEQLVEALLLARRPDDAATWASGFAEAEPYRERRWEQLMLSLYRSGRQQEALDAANRATALLRDELGIEPGSSLRDLELDILNQAEGLDAPVAAPIGIGEFVTSLRATHTGPPTPDDSFIGRNDELDWLAEHANSHRCLTIVGPPGAGKTRLATQYAAASVESRIVWINLVDVSSADIVSELGGRLGLNGDRAQLPDAIAAELDREPTTLVLDNGEHVVADLAHLVPALLGSCPSLSTVVTSRLPLGVVNERTLELGALDGDDAAQLMLERAFNGAVPGGLDATTITTLVGRLDGLPLQLELVATALRTMSPRTVLDQLDHLPEPAVDAALLDPRHRSLNTSIDWSVQLLTEPARQLHESLGAMRNGFAAQDVAEVLGADPHETSAQLAVLQHHSLVSADLTSHPTRFRQMLSVRTHARNQLQQRGTLADADRSHALFFARRAKELTAALAGPDEADAVAFLSRNRAQLAAAHHYLIDHGELDQATDLALAMWDYSFMRLDVAQFHWPVEVLNEDGADAGDRAHELAGAASMAAWAMHQFEDSDRLANVAEKLALDRATDISLFALLARANTAAFAGTVEEQTNAFIHLFTETHRRGTQRQRADMSAMFTLGQVHLGLITEARASAAESLQLSRDIDNPSSIAWATFAIGWAELTSDPLAASRSFLASTRLARTVQNRWIEGLAMSGLATSALHQNRFDQARSILVRVLELWGKTRSLPQLVRACQESAIVLAETGKTEGARTVLGYLDLLDAGHPLLPVDQERLDRLSDQLGGAADVHDASEFDPIQIWASVAELVGDDL